MRGLGFKRELGYGYEGVGILRELGVGLDGEKMELKVN